MPEALAAAKPSDPRLRRVELPGMDVEDVRVALAQDPLDPALEDAVGDETEVRTSAPGKCLPADREARHAHLDEAAVS